MRWRYEPIKAYYKEKRAQGKKHNAAVICLAHRRCDVIYALLKTKPSTSRRPYRQLN